ncbi:MAG TPA: transcription-repair coupling factor [Solirubrobacteraceae bacterium]|nr:transcription-repair coupling factor [Solirubrobacteraceae bacterium]
MLSPLLAHADDDSQTAALAREGGAAFVSQSLRPFLVAALLDRDASRPAIVVAGDDRAARDLAGGLRTWLEPRTVRYYPSRGVNYESHLAPPPHLVGLRIAALDALLSESSHSGGAPVVVVSAVALSEKVPDPSMRPRPFSLRKGDLIDLNETAMDLVAAGYERVDQVDDRGQFAIRGGLLDVFPATEDRAVRVDLFGDEIDSLRWFSTFTQRSLEEAEVVEVAPAAELSSEHRELAEIAALEDPSERPDITELLPVENFHSFLELAGGEASVLIVGNEDVVPALADHWQDVTAAFHDADAHHLYVAPDEIIAQLDERALIRLSSIDQDQPFAFRAQAADVAARGLKEAEPELEKLARSGYRTVLTFARRGEGERFAYNLGRLKTRWLAEGEDVSPQAGQIVLAHARLQAGFIAPQFHLAVIPDHRLFQRRRAAEQPGRERKRGVLRSFADLRTGDIVVHEDHGIARFAGFDTKTVAGVTRDYLYLEYAGSDRVFVPVDQLAKISRYVGAGGSHPPLSKLGGSRWDTIKARARRAAQELAGELLNLYAERRRREGHSFPMDTDWQREFEDAFPYTETPDQRDAIEFVKADMEAPRPMDRLICGDVGYGKTEVALRAGFKSAQDGKQVMVLAPTTILAQQHYGTFSERLKDYPVTIEHVSRFRSAAEQRDAIGRFAAGEVDILIGTHRLLSRDVRAKDLGLLVVDEEQRFGVKQKELLRQLKLRVDVISMSATPIPRTLQMSLAGVRDISVIETPPEGRRPVKTYVGEYDEELVRRALIREKERHGQAFFLHNRVETIDETAVRLRGLCPGMRFEVAHGQMDEGVLEKRMLNFLRGDADVLVCTSIIESGIDIPQANTLIVERADVFGLSQLYQIRGRVGRSRERAYAYLLYPSAAALTPEAANRLSALSDYTELGAGFKIAMRDLELRGAGNLLGDEQSGHVAALGFELYVEMLHETVAELSGERRVAARTVRVDARVDAYVPAAYIASEALKIDLHRRLALAEDEDALHELEVATEDRYGPLPGPVESLFRIQDAKLKLARLGADYLIFRQGRAAVGAVVLGSSELRELRALLDTAVYSTDKREVTLRADELAGALKLVDAMLAARQAG